MAVVGIEWATPLTVFAVCAWTLVVYFTITTYLSYRKLRHIPGPFLATISPAWLFYNTVRGRLYLAVEAALRKHGSPVRIGPDIIATDDPVLYRAIGAPRSQFWRGRWYEGMKFDPRVDNVLSMTNEKAHAELRTKLMPGYTGKEVPNLEADVDARMKELIHVINRDYVEKNEALDFARIAGYFTLDVLTKIAFGKELGFLAKNEDLFDYHKTSSQFYPIMELGSNHPTVLRILNSRMMQASAAPKPTDKIGLGPIISQAHKAVAERFGPDAKQYDDMLGSFVRHGLTQQECESESLLQILAGADSTATALRTTFLFILTSPSAYAKLLNEILTAVNTGQATSPVIKNREAQNLPFLQACIREGLRMFMPLHGLAGRISPKSATVAGVYIPANTEVGIATYSMNRRKDIYGPDADTFRPERWLEADEETVKKYERVQELVFGTGPSTCLGRSIALMELSKGLFELLHHFDFTIVNPFNAMKVRSNSVVVQEEMFLRAWPRQAK